MPTTNKLTDAQIRAMKAGEKPRKVSDGGGMFLYVAPGVKSWRMAYRVNGKQQTATFGLYPEVSLSEARRRRDELRAQLREGEDPRRERRSAPALAAACLSYWEGRKDISESYRANAIACLRRYVFHRLGAKPINQVTRDDIMGVLKPMDEAGRHVYVRKARLWLGLVFDKAVEDGHRDDNPASSINPKRAFVSATVKSFSALELREVPALMERLRMEGELQSVLACQFLAYTWTRTTEMRGARWEEFDGSTWVIPAERMKRRRDHVVPLPTQAVDLLGKLKRMSRGGPFVFPGDRDPHRQMSENAVLYLLHRIGYKGRMTGHGWRSVASTWANEHGYNPDAIERQLAHVPDNEVRAAYNRAKYMPERRAMLQAWADWLST